MNKCREKESLFSTHKSAIYELTLQHGTNRSQVGATKHLFSSLYKPTYRLAFAWEAVVAHWLNTRLMIKRLLVVDLILFSFLLVSFSRRS